MTAIYFS